MNTGWTEEDEPDEDEQPYGSVDTVLRGLLDRARGAEHPVDYRERFEQVVQSFRECLAANSSWVMTSTEQALVEAERALDPDGDSVATVMTPDGALEALPAFVKDAQWRPQDRALRRTKYEFCQRLVNAVMDAMPGADLGEMLSHADWALAAERRALTRGTRHPGREVPSR